MSIFWLWTLLVHADNFDAFTRTLSPTQDTGISIHGYHRVRGSAMYNLDLNHGILPNGETLYPVPLDEGQWLSGTDMRLRGDVMVTSPRGLMNVFLRVDFLDNVRLGSDAIGTPVNTTSQDTAIPSMYVRRAFSTILTPVGFVVAGRMGAHWGLGMVSNDGDCIDCDSSDASDRVAFVTSLGGHLWSAAYDFSSAGIGIERTKNRPDIDANRWDNVHSTTIAVMKVLSDSGLRRRRRGGRKTYEYGLLSSFRWQVQDVPASYMQDDYDPTPNDVMFRGYQAQLTDVWLRFTNANLRIELEAAYLHADIQQPSLYPEVLVDAPLTSDQWGFVLESDVGSDGDRLHFGMNAGLASGDPAPGFGSNNDIDMQYGSGGDIDGAQFQIGSDMRVDNFLFHSDYRIDRILFRAIIGTVTDALFLKPHMRYTLASAKTGTLTMHQALIYSQALYANSTPGGETPLGVEWNPSLEYLSSDGFGCQFDYALLFPLSGLHNTRESIVSAPGQLVRIHLRYRF